MQEVYSYDAGDKLLDVKVGGVVVKDFDYDLAGRTTGITTSAGTTTFTYDHESRAVTLTGPGMAQTNVYNGLDTRVGSTTNSVANTYLRNGAYVTAPVIKDSNATFTPGVSERRGTTTTFSHSGLKNADAQTGVSQAVNATQQYDAFGNLASSTGTWQGQFGYGGGFGYQQDATGLKLLGHRYYDSSTGRFLTRDPIKDGRNWYRYAANDPIGNRDVHGLSAGEINRGTVAGLASGVLLTPGGVDRKGTLWVGPADHTGNITPLVIALDEAHPWNKKTLGLPRPHLNSQRFKAINHRVVPEWTVPLGKGKFVRGVGAGIGFLGVAVDIAVIATSDDPGKEFAKSLTIWGGAAVGAAIGSAVLPGVGTVIGGLIGGIATGAIVGWDD